MKMAVLWVVAPCRLVEIYDVSEVLASSIIRVITALMVEAASTFEMWVSFSSLHGATSQNTAIFILTALRTCNPLSV
jgi:hypothetical protein